MLILACAAGCAALALLVCLAVTPVYTATSQVLLDPHKPHVFQESSTPDSGLDSSIVDSQIPILLSTRLLAKVIANEHLVEDPEFAAPARPGLLDRLFGLLRAPKATEAELPSFDGIDPKLQPVITALFKKIDVTRIAKSYVLSISVSSRSASKAMRLANALATTYVDDQAEVRSKSAAQTATFFEDRLGHLRDQVRQSEQAVADFRREHNLSTTTMDGKITVGGQQLQNLSEQLALAATDAAEKRARYDQGRQFKLGGDNLDTLPEVMRSPLITQLRGQEADLTRRAADLSAMYGPAYPAITQIKAQQRGLAKALASETQRLVAGLKNEYEVAKAREETLRKSIDDLTGISGGDTAVGVKLRELERSNLANKALFENFLNRAKLSQEQSTFEEPDARLISPALEPTSPSFPKTKLIVPVAFVAGLIVGLGLGVLFDALGWRMAPRAAPATGASANAFILARVPMLAGRRASPGEIQADLARRPASPFAVAVQALAEKLATPGETGRVLLLAPLAHGEGATLLATALAAALGAAERRVLLVDADVAHRGLSALMGVATRPGLSEVLAGEVPANKAVVAQPSFAVLPAGQRPLSLAADAPHLRAFLAEAAERFDLVLIDGPVFDADADVLALADAANGFAIVAAWENLLRETFIATIDAVADRDDFLGIVLNRVAPAVAEPDLALAG